MQKKVAIVIGTRPEAIKMAPLYIEMMKSNWCLPTLISTGQHKELLESVATDFDIKFDHDMSLMTHDQTLSQFVSILIKSFDDYLSNNKFDLILVHGDTITSSIISLVAFWNRIKIGHVEAGLRTYNLNSPFPEEANRQITSRIANINFCPTIQARENLLEEKINTTNIFVTGNTVIDALLFIKSKINNDSNLNYFLKSKFPENIFQKKVVLITGHRRENFGSNFEEFANAIVELSTLYPNVNFVYPVHLNPNVRKVFTKSSFQNENIYLIEPLDYKSFIYAMMHSFIILTDSGGVQEEAPALGKPVLVMRDTTERPEAISAGCAKLIGMNKISIMNEVSLLLNSDSEYKRMSTIQNPYGDGTASLKIMDSLNLFFQNDIN